MVALITALASVGLATGRNGFVVRHCVRATGHDADIAQYSGIPMPQWGVPANWCAERGAEIMEKTGAALVRDWAVDSAAVRVFSDGVMRDGLTASSLLKGMGL